MRRRAAAVRAVFKPQHLGQAQSMEVHLPPRGSVGAWLFLEYLREPLARELHLFRSPVGIRSPNAILPSGVIPAMQADLEALVAHMTHDVAGTTSDVGSREEGTVQECLHAVVLDNRGALHLAHESRAEDAADGTPGA